MLGPIVAVVGLGVFLYAQVMRRRDDPQMAEIRRRSRLRRRIALLALAAFIGYCWLTGQNPLDVLTGFLRGIFGNVNVGGLLPFAHQPPDQRHHAQGAQRGCEWHRLGHRRGDLAPADRRACNHHPASAPADAGERRGAAAPDVEEGLEDLGLERLRAEPDPRRAVIGAYALMDRVMADRALGRRRSEAPLEYLGRMTAAGYARITALGRLTRLYARARFSTHPIDRADAGRGGRRRRDHRRRGRRMTATSAVLLAAGAVVAVALLPPVPRVERRRRRRPEEPARPQGLRAMERQVGMAGGSAGDLHERLCPLLRDIARDRLATAGIDLDRDPEAAALAVGPETWELVRGDRPPPDDRHGAGVRPGRRPRRGRSPRADRCAAVSALTLEQISTRSGAVLDEVERAVVGKRPELELVLLAILADGHVLIEDYPGLAKTLVARSFAQVLDLGFARIQFTPDLLPADVTGSSIYRQGDGTFEFRPGPVFTNLLLADEINRAPPKTQSALLESMAERQVTVEGETHVLDRPFLVIATQNPIEYEGTYPLPEAQLDRFLVRARIGYPSRDDEWQVLERRRERMTDEVVLAPACAREELLAMQRAVETVHVDRSVGLYMVDLVAATRDHPQVQVGASPRGSLALLKLARCRAALDGRDFVSPDDVKAIAVPALGHRLTLRPELWVQRVSGDDVVRDCLARVPAPAPQADAATPEP